MSNKHVDESQEFRSTPPTCRVAVILASDFEDSEFRIPYDRLTQAGHQLEVIGSQRGQTVRGKRGNEEVAVERAVGDVSARDFDALVIPGGYSPDHLRMDENAVKFVRDFVALHRPIAAVCHGPQLLIEADAVRGKTLTAWPSVRTDLRNAGANVVDREVVVDDMLITSRKPDDLEAFSRAILDALGKEGASRKPSAEKTRARA